ncbi:Threonine/homoserine efflux transporter RhtA [Halorientalis persicus]|uniref:Threonine/homoserine efflux transporter RhtA n=1 Tax=Halorientalis persicus TaxID=1367881 RepID=A0A1H8UZV8_9EURY|nr:EamA family transporter [Halorientalis persicus]SEP08706.1 Threonine/homoserine efflux transporter RhtA [Halorientalis persicus]
MSTLRSVAPFLLLATLWGLSFPAISVGLDALPPVLFAAFRYDVAAVILLSAVAVRATGWSWLPSTRADSVAVAGGGLFLIAGNGFLFLGQQTVPSGVAAIIQGLVPIATVLWALVLLPEERVSAVGAVGIVVGFLGVALVIRPDPANLLTADLVGKLLICVQVTFVALGGVVVQRADADIGGTTLAGWSMAVGGVVLHTASLGLGEPLTVPVGLALAAVAYLGVFATAIAFFLYFRLLARYGATETSLVGYVVPVVATLAGVVLLDERITVASLVGFAVIFVGFLLLKRSAIRQLLA